MLLRARYELKSICLEMFSVDVFMNFKTNILYKQKMQVKF